MGLRMLVQECTTRAAGLRQFALADAEADLQVRAAQRGFDDSDRLQGLAYDAAREYFRLGYERAYQGLAALAELLAAAAEAFVARYQAEVAPGDLDEDDLVFSIRQHESYAAEGRRQVTRLAQAGSWDAVGPVQRAVNANEGVARELRLLVERMRAFDQSSVVVLADYEPVAAALAGLVAQLKLNAASTLGTPVEISSVRSLDWVSWLRPYQLLMVTYGFDERSARLINSLPGQLSSRFPELSQAELDYLFNRLLGAFQYGGYRWDETAGSLGHYFNTIIIQPNGIPVKLPWTLEQIFTDLGFAAGDYPYLAWQIKRQSSQADYAHQAGAFLKLSNPDYGKRKQEFEEHFGRPLSDEEFKGLWQAEYDRMHGKPDFAHQAITVAAILAPGDHFLPDAYAWSVGTTRVELAGWVGDTTSKADAKPFMSNGDYQADLDAVNITALMASSGLPYGAAAGQYYRDLANGAYTRADEFLRNVPLDQVLDQVAQHVMAPADPSDPLLGRDRYRPPMKELLIVKPKSDAEWFVRSLEAGSNDYLKPEEDYL